MVAPGVDDPDPFKVRAVDLAGNTSDAAVGNYRVITVDSMLRIAKGSTIVSPEGATFDDLTSGAVTGVPYVFKIIATSAYDVTMIKITGENGLEFVPAHVVGQFGHGSAGFGFRSFNIGTDAPDLRLVHGDGLLHRAGSEGNEYNIGQTLHSAVE